MAYDVIDILDDDNFASKLEVKLNISILLIGIVRTTNIEPIILDKNGVISPKKV